MRAHRKDLCAAKTATRAMVRRFVLRCSRLSFPFRSRETFAAVHLHSPADLVGFHLSNVVAGQLGRDPMHLDHQPKEASAKVSHRPSPAAAVLESLRSGFRGRKV